MLHECKDTSRPSGHMWQYPASNDTDSVLDTTTPEPGIGSIDTWYLVLGTALQYHTGLRRSALGNEFSSSGNKCCCTAQSAGRRCTNITGKEAQCLLPPLSPYYPRNYLTLALYFTWDFCSYIFWSLHISLRYWDLYVYRLLTQKNKLKKKKYQSAVGGAAHHIWDPETVSA